MKKVLFIDHCSVVGGSQLVLLNYLKYLDKSKIQPFVVCSNSVPWLVDEYSKNSAQTFTISFDQLKRPSISVIFNLIKSVISIIKIINSQKIELVATNTERALYVGSIAALLTGRKQLWFIRDFLYNKFLLKLLSLLNPKIICVSQAIKRFYKFGDNALVIYVSSDMYKKSQAVMQSYIDEFKEKYNIQNKFVVAYIGSLAKWKGYHMLANAFSKISDPNIVCLIVGEPDMSSENKEFNTNFLESAKKQKNVIFTGFVKNAALVFRSVDVFVHPALNPEPYATSIVEAMMSKTPVIATNTGGTSEIVVHNKTGLLINPWSEDEIINSINLLYKDSNMRNLLLTNAYEFVLSNNKIEDEVIKLEKIFTND